MSIRFYLISARLNSIIFVDAKDQSVSPEAQLHAEESPNRKGKALFQEKVGKERTRGQQEKSTERVRGPGTTRVFPIRRLPSEGHRLRLRLRLFFSIVPPGRILLIDLCT